jgi:lipopolysaccharide export system ATP-binding protein
VFRPYLSVDNLMNKKSGLYVEGLRKVYKSKIVLMDFNISLKKGEVVSLLGPNGAGKTTAFNIISGITKADGGTIKLDGYDISNLPMYRRSISGLGYLPQESSIFKGLTVENNILAILELRIKDKRERRRKIEELLGDFSITHLRRAKANNLSGGERRRVEIARCLASQPSYILLDEPFAGVDPIAIDDIRSLVSDLKNRNLGVLITDHNVRETLKIVDKAYIIHEGKIIKYGSPEFVINDPSVRNVYLGEKFTL